MTRASRRVDRGLYCAWCGAEGDVPHASFCRISVGYQGDPLELPHEIPSVPAGSISREGYEPTDEVPIADVVDAVSHALIVDLFDLEDRGRVPVTPRQ